MEILYKVHNNLYVNLTNKCPYACTFCLRQTMDRIGESDRLWLEREPSVEEVKKEFEKFDMTQYNEVVFCGFGEPTERFDALKEEYLKLVRSKFGEESFDAMLSFAKACTKYVPHVVMTTVDTTISHEQEAQCQKICDEIGAAYRIRPWED